MKRLIGGDCGSVGRSGLLAPRRRQSPVKEFGQSPTPPGRAPVGIAGQK